MNSNNKIIARNTIFLYGRLLLTMLIGLYTSRIILQTLGVEDYGIYSLVGGFVSLLAIFTFSIGSTCQRFLVVELGRGNKEKLNEIFCTISIILVAFSLLFFIVFGIIGTLIVINILNIPIGKIETAVVVFICSLSTFCIQLISTPYSSLVIAHERMDFYAIVSVMETIAKLIIVFLLLYVEWNKLIFYSILLTTISFIVVLVYRLYCKMSFPESSFRWSIKRNVVKDLTSFSFWIGLGSFAGLLKDQGGNILINLYYGVSLNAACGIANQVKSLVSQLSTNIGLAISPQITKSYSSGNVERSVQLTFFLAKSEILLMMLIALPLLVETRRILTLWLGIVPQYTIDFVRLLLLLNMTQTLGLSYAPLFFAIGKVKRFQLYSSIITLMVLPITFLCYQVDLHPSSYYIVCIIIEIILFIYSYVFLVLEVDFPFIDFIKEVLARLIIVGFLPILTVMLVKSFVSRVLDNSYMQMSMNIIICLLMYSICVFYIGLKKNERNLCLKYLVTKFKRV